MFPENPDSVSKDAEGNDSSLSRREAVKTLGGAGLASLLGGLSGTEAQAAPAHRPRVEEQTRIGAAQANYVFPRAPLAEVPYAQLPIGAVEPKGWLKEQLRRMGDGMAGHLDELYSNVSPENAWTGGSGDNWERGPYWIDGLTPLAYLLGDQELIDKAERWIEWSLESQQPSGYFGPDPEKTYDEGPQGKSGAFIQTGNAADWWPRMVMLKAMRSYHAATGDERVLGFMTDYFRYQQRTLPEKPLDHWTWWAKMRGGENQESIYWLYNRTGDDFLLDLAQTVFEQTAGWTEGFLANDLPSRHGVNVGMAVKQPVVNYLQSKDEKHLRAARHALDWLMEHHGQAQGMFSGDELLHGTAPVQGTELCTVVELMYSLQNLARTTGQVRYMDHLERVAYNALPTQHKDDYMGRQYYQQPNQIQISQAPKNFITGSSGTRLAYGLSTGYPCCTVNMHQGWPKYARNLWMAAPGGGLAALFYAANAVDAKVADGVEVHFEEKTDYPFDDTVRFEFSSREAVRFPLHLRIPEWVEGNARIRVNGRRHATPEAGRVAKVDRQWESGDTLELTLPMAVGISRWHEKSAAVERGPLVYALRIGEDWRKLSEEDYEPAWEENYEVPAWTVFPRAPWNYGLVMDRDAPEEAFEVVEAEGDLPDYPWSLESAPVKLVAQGKRLPQWQEYHEGAGPLPPSPVRSGEPVEEITLVPYGASTLRISEFPVVRT